MSSTIIAWNRFGLGATGTDKPLVDPKKWLFDQIDSFDPTPDVIAHRRTSKMATANLIEYRDRRREMRRAAANANMSMEDMRNAEGDPAMSDASQQMRRGIRSDYLGDVSARGLVAAQSTTPFMERMVHFWSNHFAISVRKNQTRGLAGPREFEAIRPNIRGSFAQLLKASVLHPAMLIYLDQIRSVGPGSIAGKRARTRSNRDLGLNENLGREILELHTLGVRSGYSQADVTELARALTGWSITGIGRMRRAVALPNGSAFETRIHEPGRRTIMGKSYKDTGGQQALSILDDLATHPKTARHIATKLARHFAADDPPPAMVARLEKAFLDSGGDLPTVYRALINSPEAWIAGPQKFRQPWEWAIAALRATEATMPNERRFYGLLRELGQLPWGPTSPAGYADTMANWAGPDALIRRVESAERLARGYRSDDVPALARAMFGDTLNDTTATAIRRAESPRQGLALLLASPEMMRR